MATMDTSVNITAASFAAYLKCLTKSYLITQGETPPDAFVSETLGRISVAYKASATQSFRMESTGAVPIDFVGLTNNSVPDANTIFVDCETAFYVCDQAAVAAGGLRINRSQLRRDFIPIRYSAWDRSDQSDDLLVCFCALAIGRVTGGI